MPITITITNENLEMREGTRRVLHESRYYARGEVRCTSCNKWYPSNIGDRCPDPTCHQKLKRHRHCYVAKERTKREALREHTRIG